MRDAGLRLSHAVRQLGWQVMAMFLGRDGMGRWVYRIIFDWPSDLVGQAPPPGDSFVLATGVDTEVRALPGFEEVLFDAMRSPDTYGRILGLSREPGHGLVFEMMQDMPASNIDQRPIGLWVQWQPHQVSVPILFLV